MSIASFMAAQLRRPSGSFGRHILLRMLNRSNLPMNELVLKVLNLIPQDIVLEVGFGGGDLLSKIAKAATKGSIAGVDFSPEAVEACSRRFQKQIAAGSMELQCANAEELPFEDNTFTKVCAVNVIYFWADPILPLKQIHRVLADNGVLVLCFTPRVFLEDRSVMKHGFTLYDQPEVIAHFIEAGFQDVRISFGNHYLGQFITVEGKKINAHT